MKPKYLGASALPFLAAALAAPALAQSADVITVTAQKREQNLQDVPISMVAVSGEELLEDNVIRLDQLDESIPNLAITDGFTGVTLNVRGIGTGQGSAGFEQSVATFIDGVYVGRGRSSIAPMMDIASVEVLRGPQPVFSGQSAVAGALNITTKDGTGDFAADLFASYGSENEVIVEGGVTLPMTDTFGVRLAGRATGWDGYATNAATGGSHGGIDTEIFRATANWTPAARLDLELAYEAGKSESNGLATEIIDCDTVGVPGSPPPICAFAQGDPTFADVNLEYDLNQMTAVGSDWLYAGVGVPNTSGWGDLMPETLTTDRLTFNWNYDFGGATLTGIHSTNSYNYSVTRDVDQTPYMWLHADIYEDYDQTNHELRLTSNDAAFDGFLDWMVGYYYQEGEIHTENHSHLGFAGFDVGTEFNEDNEWTSFFASFTGHFTDTVRGNAGIRYSDVSKSGDTYATTGTGNAASGNGTFSRNVSTCTGGEQPGVCMDANYETDDVSWQLGLEWDAADDVMFYVSYSDAFKAGGFAQSGQNVVGSLDAFIFDDEEANSFEVGMNSILMDGRLRLNGAIFSTDYTNLQLSSFDVNSGTFLVNNAAAATSQGIEFDGVFALTDSFDVIFNGSLLDATFDSYDGAQCSQWEQSFDLNGCSFDNDGGNVDIVSTTDRSGYDLLFSPSYTFGLGFDWSFPISDTFEGGLAGDVNWRDDYEVSDRYDPRGLQEGYAMVNLRAELFSDSGWSAALFGNNVTDETPLILLGPSQFNGQTAGFAVSQRGASYGIQLRARFGG